MQQLNFYDRPVWGTFVQPGEVIEARFIKVNGYATHSGYFDDHELFCKFVKQLDATQHGGAYFSLQGIDPRLIGRAFNRIKKSDLTTSDHDVRFYRWLPIDLDPIRPAGISSSDAELSAALELRDVVAAHCITEMGFSKPIRAMSGNGGHLLFRLPDLPANDETKKMIKNILCGLAEKFDTAAVKIDTTVFNPARIWKLYGTAARKGDSLPAGEYREARPHRTSYIDDIGG
jgi:hypothetical protein